MQALSTLKSASFLVFDQASRPKTSPATTTSAALLGAKKGDVAGQRQFVAFDSIYSVNHLDATKQKINLMERLGKAFGFDIETFKDMGGLAEAVERELAKLDPRAAMAAEQAVAKDLGLDELGFSLRDLLDAMKNPGGETDRKLEASLTGQTDRSQRGEGSPVLDDIGRYSPAFATR